MAGSKNNPNNKNVHKVKLAYSNDCEECQEKCSKGIEYLRVFAIRKEGIGVVCRKD